MALHTFLKKITAHFQSVLCKFSLLFLPGIQKTPLDMSKLGLNIIKLISKRYGGVFL